jgi:hypothetical protein
LKKEYYKPYLEATEPLFVKPSKLFKDRRIRELKGKGADGGVGEFVVYERLNGWATVSDLHTEGKYQC